MAETKYKQTELGLIPEEWGCKSIGEVGNTYAGLTGKSKQDFVKGNALYITFLNVLNNPILKPELFESVYVGVNERQNKAQKGDLFFNTSSETPEEVGICAMLDKDFSNLYLNSFCFGYRLKDNSIIPLFLSYYFRSDVGRRMMTAAAQGVTRYNLSKSTFNKLKIPLPPLAEQRAIASALTSIDNLIASLDKQIAKTHKVKHGAMQQLLTGLNTEDVTWKPLGEVVNFSDGFPFDSSSFRSSGKYAVIRISDLSNYNVVRGDKYIEYLPAKIKEAQILVGGEILIAMSGSTGKVGYNKSCNLVVNQRIAIIRSKDEILREYLKHILLNSKFEEYCFKQGTGIQNNIGKDVILDYLIPYPSMDTQHRIASTLTAIDDQISALEAKRKKYEMVKVGMMQQLLTGKIRLK